MYGLGYMWVQRSVDRSSSSGVMGVWWDEVGEGNMQTIKHELTEEFGCLYYNNPEMMTRSNFKPNFESLNREGLEELMTSSTCSF